MTLVLGGPALPESSAPRRKFGILIFSFISLLALFAFAPSALAQQYDPAIYAGMQWRQVGPFRAGRVSDVSGVPGQPAIYYMGTAGGGAWKNAREVIAIASALVPEATVRTVIRIIEA